MKLTLQILLLSLAGLASLAVSPAGAQNGSDDPYFNAEGSWGQDYADQWAINRVGLTGDRQSAWAQMGRDGSDVVVAVIDTGLDWHHADIDWGQIWRNPGEIPDNDVDDDGNGYIDDIIGWNFMSENNQPWDHDGHGTFVTGIIAAGTNNTIGIRGINDRAQIMVIKALNNFGHTRASDIAEAIVYAADNGADVINLSVGGAGTTQVEDEALAYAAERGVVIIVAAGNEGVQIEDWGIAGSELVITVAATGFDDERAVFSNWGRGIDIAAPGLDILSLRARRTDTMRGIPGVAYEDAAAYVGEDNRYYRASGTSFAAPIVAGAASLLLTQRPELSAEEVRQILLNSARDVGSPGIDQYTGYGLLDVTAALTSDAGFILALIDRVEVVSTDAGTQVRVFGTADATNFSSATLDLGQGENPDQWTQITDQTSQSAETGALGDIPAAAFGGALVWTLRLTVTDTNGSTREARYVLNLG
jgi:subtilisin family serine protease